MLQSVKFEEDKIRYTVICKQQQQQFYGPLSGTTQVSQYQKKHSPTHHPDHYPIFIGAVSGKLPFGIP